MATDENMKHQDPTYLLQIACPSCGDLSDVSYCEIGAMYTWWCDNRSCGKQYKFKVNPDGSTDSVPTGTVITSVEVTLKIPPQKEDIFVTVLGGISNEDTDDSYCFEATTCPVNLFAKGVEVSLGNNEDPHGLFKHVKTEKIGEENDH